MPREISVSELASRLRAAEPLLLLDVREPWERAIAHLPGDVHVPMDEIPRRAGELAGGPLVVVYCHAGVRSFAVAAFLEQQGLEAVSLAGGIDAWADEVDPRMARY